jgi:hypothetical protein
MRHRRPAERQLGPKPQFGPDPAETPAAIIGLILIALVMLTSPEAPAMHGAQIARFYDAR